MCCVAHPISGPALACSADASVSWSWIAFELAPCAEKLVSSLSLEASLDVRGDGAWEGMGRGAREEARRSKTTLRSFGVAPVSFLRISALSYRYMVLYVIS